MGRLPTGADRSVRAPQYRVRQLVASRAGGPRAGLNAHRPACQEGPLHVGQVREQDTEDLKIAQRA